MRERWYGRVAVVALAAAALGGCGGGGDTWSGKAAPLDAAQARSVMPDVRAMPGWHLDEGPGTQAATAPGARSTVCADRELCAGARVEGYVTLGSKGGREVAKFWMIAYKDQAAAHAAYGPTWQRSAWMAGREKVDVGALGQERGGRFGTALHHADTLYGQVRVGTVVLSSRITAPMGKLDKDSAKAMVKMFAQRAQQAQNGDKPSARLPYARSSG